MQKMPYWKAQQDPNQLQDLPYKLAKKQERAKLFQDILKQNTNLDEEDDPESDIEVRLLNEERKKEEGDHNWKVSKTKDLATLATKWKN